MKVNPRNGYFKENQTIKTTENGEEVYYERAQDKEGNWLKIGDWVRIVDSDDSQKDLRGSRRKIIGIFEGDLMLEEEPNYNYCWPRKVIKDSNKQHACF